MGGELLAMRTGLRKRWGISFCLFAALAPAASRQSASPPFSAGKQDRMCVVEGRVTELDGTTPIRGAKVTLGGTRIAAETDTGGHYVLQGVPAGEHRVVVEKDGYGRETFQRRIRVSDGQRLSGIDVRLKKEAVVSGRVFDGAKRPLAGVQVCALRHVFQHGRKGASPFTCEKTNDEGQYRITGLTEGYWHVGAFRSDVAGIRIARGPVRNRIRKGTSLMVIYPNYPSF